MAAPIRFQFKPGRSSIYGTLRRPVAKVYLRSGRGTWLPHFMLVDTGADFTLLPRSIGEVLGFQEGSAEPRKPAGTVGGKITVLMRRVEMRIGLHEFKADVGWADTDDVPLLLGRVDVFDRFDVTFRQRDRVLEFRWRRE